jgi:hypothetical protein
MRTTQNALVVVPSGSAVRESSLMFFSVRRLREK